MKSTRMNYLVLVIVLISAVIILFTVSRNDFTDRSGKKEKEILLYFSDDKAMYLQPESRTIVTASDKKSIYKMTLNELIQGPKKENLKPTIPDGVEIINLQIEGKIIIINFNQALKENHWGGSTGERMTIYSVINTMTQFEDIEKVGFLLEGEEIESLVGHMDLRRPLVRNEQIIQE